MKKFLFAAIFLCININLLATDNDQQLETLATNGSFNGRFWNQDQSQAQIYLLGILEYENFCYAKDKNDQKNLITLGYLASEKKYTIVDICSTISMFYQNPKYVTIPIAAMYVASILYLIVLTHAQTEELLDGILLNINKPETSTFDYIMSYLKQNKGN